MTPPERAPSRAIASVGARASRRIVVASLIAAATLAIALAWPLAGPRGEILQVVSGGEELPSASPAPVAAAVGTATPPPVPVDDDLRTATLPTPPAPDELTGYVWPLPRGRLTLPFGPTPWGSRLVDGERFHDGVDLATFCGDRIVAAHDGVVLAAGRRYDRFMGWRGDLRPYLDRLEAKRLWITLPIVVVIDDGNGYRSMYAHFGKVVVKPGQVVKAGQLIGYEGRTGRASGCHLHYGLFSPLERATFGIAPDVVKRMLLPAKEIARIDPLLVLPERPAATAKPKPAPTPTPALPVVP